MKQIDFITQFPKSYTYETYVANHLKSVCAAEGICTNMIYLSEGTFGKYLHKIRKTPPAWVLSFVNLFPGEPPLCDILEVPHFCLPHKGLFEIFSFDPSPSQYIGLSDGKLCRHLHDNGFSHYLPLPPAVDATLRGVQEEEKCFEVVLFEDLIDMDCLKKTWQELFPSHQYQFLEKTLHLCLEQSEKHPFEVLHRVLQEEGSEEDRNRFSDILYSVEEGLKALRTVSLIESMQGVRIDVFGEHIGNQWLQRLKNKQDVFLHWSLPYTEHFEVLRRSKLLLRHQIPGSEGADEWVFPALCCGCLPLSNDAPFLMQHLGKALPYYSSFQEIHSLAHHFLKRPQERMETTESLKQKILPAHSWSARGKELLAYLKTKSP